MRGLNPLSAPREVGLGDLEIEDGLALGLVLGLDQLPGGPFVGRLQARPFAGLSVHAVKRVTPTAPTCEAESCFHVCECKHDDKRNRSRRVREQRESYRPLPQALTEW